MSIIIDKNKKLINIINAYKYPNIYICIYINSYIYTNSKGNGFSCTIIFINKNSYTKCFNIMLPSGYLLCKKNNIIDNIRSVEFKMIHPNFRMYHLFYSFFIYNKYYSFYNNLKEYNIPDSICSYKLFNSLDFYRIYSFIVDATKKRKIRILRGN